MLPNVKRDQCLKWMGRRKARLKGDFIPKMLPAASACWYFGWFVFLLGSFLYFWNPLEKHEIIFIITFFFLKLPHEWTVYWEIPTAHGEMGRRSNQAEFKRSAGVGGHAGSHTVGSERAADLGLRKLTEAFTGTNLMKEQLDWSMTYLGSAYCQPSISTGAHPIRYQKTRMLKSFIPMVQYLHITYTQPFTYFKSPLDYLWYLINGASGKEPNCPCRKHKRLTFSPWVGKIPCRRAWQPTPLFLPGESHGQRSLVGYSPRSHKESDTTDVA